MKVTRLESTTTYNFKDKAELDNWAKQNITNTNVVNAVLEPVMVKGKPKNNVVYEKATPKSG
jgi:hypothetical protein